MRLQAENCFSILTNWLNMRNPFFFFVTRSMPQLQFTVLSIPRIYTLYWSWRFCTICFQLLTIGMPANYSIWYPSAVTILTYRKGPHGQIMIHNYLRPRIICGACYDYIDARGLYPKTRVNPSPKAALPLPHSSQEKREKNILSSSHRQR